MRPVTRGLLVALLQVLIVAAVGGKLLYDRQVLPKVWVRTAGVDPELPIRGRYVSLRLVVQADGLELSAGSSRERYQVHPVKLAIVDGALHAVALADRDGSYPLESMVQQLATPAGPVWALVQPIAFYLPEDAPDPSRLAAGETLWAEVTVPAEGPPRPLRLEVRQAQQPAAGAPPDAS